MFATVLNHCLFGQILIALRDDGFDGFTPALTGYPNHCRVSNAWMLHQHIFNLSRIDVLTPANDHIFDTVVNIEIAAFQVSGITAAKPLVVKAIFGRLIIAPVSTHDLRSAHADFTDRFVGADGSGLCIDNAYFVIANRLAARTQQVRTRTAGIMVLGCQNRNSAGRFGKTVGLHELTTEGLHRFNQDGFRNGRSAVGDGSH